MIPTGRAIGGFAEEINDDYVQITHEVWKPRYRVLVLPLK
jgi:hypothetical protein